MHPVMTGLSACLTTAAVLLSAGATFGVTLYSENFEVDPSANWTVNNGPSDEAHNFFFDYSTVGIPSAPNSGGTTTGMKLQANLNDGVFGGMSVSPTGQSFTGDYKLTFDWWSNYNGPLNTGGSGSTNLSMFGIGTAGDSAQWPGAAVKDSVFFAATGDGGSASDYRAYSTAAPTSYAAGNAVYAAPGGAINHTDAYYAGFGNVAAPAAQLALFPGQTDNVPTGAAGMAWHQVEIIKSGDLVTWLIDGLLIATIDLNTVTLGGTNILFGHSDTNTSSSTDANRAALIFTLIDNILVTSLDREGVIPEPVTSGLALLGLVALGVVTRRRR